MFFELTKEYDKWNFEIDDFNNTQFIKEPGLISSCVDNDSLISYKMLTLFFNNQKIGNLSFFINKNKHKLERFLYARIDLVVTPNKFRGLGISHILNAYSLIYLLNEFSNDIYSISCLAAHPGIEKSLLKFQFECIQNENENFSRMSKAIDSEMIESYKQFLESQLKNLLQITNYKLIQKEKNNEL